MKRQPKKQKPSGSGAI